MQLLKRLKGTLTFNGHEPAMHIGSEDGTPEIARVTARKKLDNLLAQRLRCSVR